MATNVLERLPLTGLIIKREMLQSFLEEKKLIDEGGTTNSGNCLQSLTKEQRFEKHHQTSANGRPRPRNAIGCTMLQTRGIRVSGFG